MTLPNNEPHRRRATKREQDSSRSSIRQLLKGTFSLAFEGQCFVPTGDQREYWLDINDETLKRLIELLKPLGWQLETEVFQVEFWGTLSWVGGGCGHFGIFGGTAWIDEIVSVAFARAEPVGKSKARSIRGTLRMPRP